MGRSLTTANKFWPLMTTYLQLNEYETAPCFIQFSQNFEHQNRTILGSAQVNLGENTEINKKTNVEFWLN